MPDVDGVTGHAAAVGSSGIPAARALRRWVRRARRAHHSGSLGDVLSDAYTILLLVALYGWGGVTGIRRYLKSPESQTAQPEVRYWIAVAAALATAGLVWYGLRTLGPLLVTPAGQAWLFSAPVDRRALLAPRFAALVGGTGAGGGLLGLGAAAAVGPDQAATLVWSAVAGAVGGAGGAGLAVLAQAAGREPRWSRLLGRGLIVAAAAIALVVVTAGVCPPSQGWCRGIALPEPLGPLTAGPALAAGLAAVAVTVLAGRALGRVDRAALTAGVDLAHAATAAAFLLDPSMLTAQVESRRWRAVGRVRSGSLVADRPARYAGVARRFLMLVRAELRRRGRDRAGLALAAALLLVMYAIAVALPEIEGSAHIVLTYLVANRLASGLRAIARSPGLRRALGGRDAVLHAAHLVVPALGAVGWYAAALPVVRPWGWLDAVLLLGLVVAVLRTATRRPIQHGGPVADTPFGMIPVDLIRQVTQGPDLVAGLVVLELVLG